MEVSGDQVTPDFTVKNDLSTVVSVFERKTPLNLAETWDNVGLLVEPPKLKTINSILFTNDLTENVVDEAISKNVNLIYSYHPPIFAPIKTFKNDKWKSRIIMECIQANIAVFSPHTASDAIVGGVNDWLIDCFEIKDVHPIKRSEHSNDQTYNIECKISEEFAQHISNVPTLKIIPSGDNRDNKLIQVASQHLSEVLLEFVRSKDVEIHSCNKLPVPDCGLGRIGQLKAPITISDAVKTVKNYLQLNHVRISLGKHHELGSQVKSVAVCAGSGATVLRGAASDLYITGEMSHHELLDASHNDITVILCEHSNTERGYLRKLTKDLASNLKGIKLIVSEKDKDPVDIV